MDENFVDGASDSDSDNMSYDGEADSLNVVNEDVPKDGDTSEFITLGPDDLIQHMTELMNDVFQITNLPKTIIRILMEHYKWDKDVLIEQFFEHTQSHLFSNVKLVPFVGADGELLRLSLRSYATVHPKDLLGLGCNHFFCRSCWRLYLTSKVMEDSQGTRLACPAFNCTNPIADEGIFEVLRDAGENAPRIVRRFQKLLTNSFVLQNRTLTWCPGLDCGHAVRILVPGGTSGLGDKARLAICGNCGENFCFACGNPWHQPALCESLKRWLSRVTHDSGTSHWIAANTKECPRCKATIEKNGGCNHMVCRNQNCRYEFCWVCLDGWEPHGSQWYGCNRFKENAAQQARDAQEMSRAALTRYLFYFDRYANHEQSRRFESKLYESVQGRMEELQNQGMSWIDVKFVKHVVDVLCACRRTLMYTYVFAFYLESDNESAIFEVNQSDLEQATEQLSEFLEWDLSTATLVELKQKLQDKSRYCEQRRQVLLFHVSDGYEKETWKHRTNI